MPPCTKPSVAAGAGDRAAAAARGRYEALHSAPEAAMYEAKRRGGGRVRVFSNESRQGKEETSATEVDLRAALTKSEMVLHYQPVIDLTRGRAVAVEALVRWQHPARGGRRP